MNGVAVEAEILCCLHTVVGLRRFTALPQSFGNPPQHKLPLLGELGFDGLVEFGCVFDAGEVPLGSLGDGYMLRPLLRIVGGWMRIVLPLSAIGRCHLGNPNS